MTAVVMVMVMMMLMMMMMMMITMMEMQLIFGRKEGQWFRMQSGSTDLHCNPSR